MGREHREIDFRMLFRKRDNLIADECRNGVGRARRKGRSEYKYSIAGISLHQEYALITMPNSGESSR